MSSALHSYVTRPFDRLCLGVSILLLMVAGAILPIGTHANESDVRIERVVGPEVRTGPYKHPGSITELANGDLYVVFFSGQGEYQDQTAAVYGTRLSRGSRRWSRPMMVASNPFHALGNPVVWQAPDGVVWLFYVTRHGDLWDTSRITGKISHDNAKSWSEPFQITYEAGTMTRSRPIVLPDGQYLLPIYHEVGDDPEAVGPDCTSLFLRFDPVKRIWLESNRVRSRLGNIQPAAAWVADQHLIAFCRRGGDYAGQPDGWMVRTESRDGGRTWSDGEDFSLPNPNAAVDFIRLQSGNHLLVYNPSFSERTPLTVALSTDGGKTFAQHRDLVSDPDNSYAYPTVIQRGNGEIQILFTADERTTLKRAIFRESLFAAPQE